MVCRGDRLEGIDELLQFVFRHPLLPRLRGPHGVVHVKGEDAVVLFAKLIVQNKPIITFSIIVPSK